MKNTILFILSIFAVFSFTACDDENSLEFIAKENEEGIFFTNNFLSEYFIAESFENNVAERFVWDPADFDAPVNVTYELQGSIDPEFNTFEVVGSTSETNIVVTVGQLLQFAEQLNLDNDPATTNEAGSPNNTGQVYFRVRAYTGTDAANALESFSDIQPLNIFWLEKTGDEEVVVKDLYFVGNAVAPGWDNNANNPPLYRSPDNEEVYFYTGKFVAGEFKILEERGAWQPQWGTNDGTTLAVNDGTGSDPGAFVIDADGYYSFEANLADGTFSIAPFDASAATTYSTIGIIGDATANGWDSDTDMTQLAFDPHIWYINGVALGDGEMKFRAGDAWDTNWGSDTPITGQATFEGPNIPVVAGTYDIWFNDLTGRYIFLAVE